MLDQVQSCPKHVKLHYRYSPFKLKFIGLAMAQWVANESNQITRGPHSQAGAVSLRLTHENVSGMKIPFIAFMNVRGTYIFYILYFSSSTRGRSSGIFYHAYTYCWPLASEEKCRFNKLLKQYCICASRTARGINIWRKRVCCVPGCTHWILLPLRLTVVKRVWRT
jgi:hypothetical protein